MPGSAQAAPAVWMAAGASLPVESMPLPPGGPWAAPPTALTSFQQRVFDAFSWCVPRRAPLLHDVQRQPRCVGAIWLHGVPDHDLVTMPLCELYVWPHFPKVGVSVVHDDRCNTKLHGRRTTGAVLRVELGNPLGLESVFLAPCLLVYSGEVVVSRQYEGTPKCRWQRRKELAAIGAGTQEARAGEVAPKIAWPIVDLPDPGSPRIMYTMRSQGPTSSAALAATPAEPNEGPRNVAVTPPPNSAPEIKMAARLANSPLWTSAPKRDPTPSAKRLLATGSRDAEGAVAKCAGAVKPITANALSTSRMP
eukprot:CAMPEP_0117511290 /NCGR_PEP_ID=MMETSP0784-20121206/28432_1 /TAXON_ID=39447 /ORGANISM="" /LENGTH=306 /DNA_ID=CAMNT_0005306959 /DNA_START=88 /DNA_END=1007 /DNA_ORIENTATION=+